MTELTADQTTLPAPAESTLIYCFADRYVRKPGRLGGGVKIPLSGLDVDHIVLANTLFAVAFGSLARRGKLSLVEIEHKTLFVKSRRLTAAVAADANVEGESPSSLEHNILKVSRPGTAHEVKEIIRGIYGQDVKDSRGQVLAFVRSNMIKTGLMEQQAQAGTIGKTALTWLNDRIQPSGDLADHAWQAYEAWSGAEPLFNKMFSEISAGIASRQESDDSDDD